VTTHDAQTFARALYDSLISSGLQQLQAAAGKLRSGDAAHVATQLDEALGPNANPALRNFVLAMANENALGLLPQVAEAFAVYGKAPTRLVEAEITSAEELSGEQRAKIERDVQQKYGQGTLLRFKVDESLIGGLIIRVGDRVIDNSLRARLSELQRNLQAS
jgi:F-type H+-transporting ATPase subunit delta